MYTQCNDTNHPPSSTRFSTQLKERQREVDARTSLDYRYEAPNAQTQLETSRPKASKAVHKGDHMEELRKAEEKIGHLGLVPRRSMDGTHGPWVNMVGLLCWCPVPTS